MLNQRFTFTSMIVIALVGISFAFAAQEIDTDPPLEAYVKEYIQGAWMKGESQCTCDKFGVDYGWWEIYIKFDSGNKKELDGAVSGVKIDEIVKDTKHSGQRPANLNRISVSSYIEGYDKPKEKNVWASAWL